MRVRISPAAPTQVISVGIQGPQGPQSSLATLPDVNLTNLQNGSVLVYSNSTQKWVSTTTLESQNVEGGFF